jgi:hypothetical protein
MEHIQEELNTVMEVMISDVFIYLDLVVFSFIFTILLSSTLHSLAMSILFFLGSYSFFACVYSLVFNRKVKKIKS